MESVPGGVELTLAPRTHYRAVEVVTERKFKGRREEWLVRWVLQRPATTEGGKLTKEQEKDWKEVELRARKEYCVWMRREEMQACCPHLFSFKPAPSTSMAPKPTSEGGGSVEDMESPAPPVFSEAGEDLEEMKSDVRTLISRARRLMTREGGSSSPATGRILTNIVNILNAYAKIGMLSEAFQEYGAVDLLLGLLTFPDLDVRRCSNGMLRSLTTYDHSIRGYVLLQLINSSKDSKTSFQSREMMLDLFSETASSYDESSVRGITLPQVF